MLHFLKKFKMLDIYGMEFKFNIQGSKYQTIAGGIFSIFSFLSILLAIYYYGDECYNRQNPRISIEEYPLEYEPKINISKFKENLRISYSVAFKGFPPISAREFFKNYYLGIYKTEYNNSSIAHKEALNEIRTINNYNSSISYNGKIGKMEFLEDPDKYFDGSKSSRENTTDEEFLIFSLTRCIYNNTNLENRLSYNTSQCNKVDDYEEELPTIDLTINDQVFNIKKSDYYLSRNYNKVSITVDKKKTYIKYLRLTVSEIRADIGFLFANIQTSYIFTIEEEPLTEEIYRNDFGLNVLVKTNNKYKIYNISYMSIPEVLAEVGGIKEAISLIISVVYGFFLDNSYRTFMIKKLFKLSVECDNSEDESKELENLSLNRSANIRKSLKIELEQSRNYKNGLELKELKELKEELPKLEGNCSNSTGVKPPMEAVKCSKCEKTSCSCFGRVINVPKVKNDESIYMPDFTADNINALNNSSNNSAIAFNSKNSAEPKINTKSKSTTFEPIQDILNIDLKRLVMQKKPNKVLRISKTNRFYLTYLSCCRKDVSSYSENINSKEEKKKLTENDIKYNLLLRAEYYLDKKFDIIQLFKEVDKIRLLKRVVLNGMKVNVSF